MFHPGPRRTPSTNGCSAPRASSQDSSAGSTAGTSFGLVLPGPEVRAETLRSFDVAGATAPSTIPLVRMDHADRRAVRGADGVGPARGLCRAPSRSATRSRPSRRSSPRYCGTDYAVGVSSGTEAIALSLRALGVEPGSEVIVPANSFIATAEAVSLVGATPRLVDVDPESHNLTGEIVERNLTRRTACVIPVHLYGRPVEMDSRARRGARRRRAGPRGRMPGAWGRLSRPAGRVDRALRLLQLLPGEEPRRLGGRGRGRDLGPGARATAIRLFRSHGERASATTTRSRVPPPGSTRSRRPSCA